MRVRAPPPVSPCFKGFEWFSRYETKNGERRSIVATGEALELLRARAKVRRLDTRLVFPGGTRPDRTIPPADIRTAWDHAAARAELHDFTFHDLRHTAASYLAMSGATLAEIAAVLGHNTLAMVKRYAHIGESHTAGVVQRMNEKSLGAGR